MTGIEGGICDAAITNELNSLYSKISLPDS